MSDIIPATVVGDGPVPDTSMCDRIKCPACGLTAYMDPGPHVAELVAAAKSVLDEIDQHPTLLPHTIGLRAALRLFEEAPQCP